MTVRSALARINEVLDEVLSEQEGDFDDTTRFCLTWFRQHGYGEGAFGDADNMARGRNTAVASLERAQVLHSARGKVRIFRPSELPDGYDVVEDDLVSTWEALHHLIRILEADDVAAAGRFLALATSRDDGAIEAANVTELAHLLFRICEDNGWAKEAIAFNDLVTSWLDIMEASRSGDVATQGQLDFEATHEEGRLNGDQQP